MKSKLTLLLAAFAFCLSAQDYDILIRNGKIVDGTGDPSFHGDVGIKAGKIVAMGKLMNKTATRTIDATGLVISPGFFDMHNHSDNALLTDGDAMSFITQGVTAVVLGEGNSQAPSERFPRFTDYWKALAQKGISLNVASYVGAGQVFTTVHGMKAGPLTPAEVEKERVFVRQAMEDGALGVCSMLGFPPGFWETTDELTEMAKVAGQYGGTYASHIRDEGATVMKALS
jgi:N-acyl-D-amino-acid deacylase